MKESTRMKTLDFSVALTLPLTFGRLVAAENLASWTVYVDGERSFASAVGVDGGRLAVTTANGTVLILR